MYDVARTNRNNLSKELQMIERLEPDTFHTTTFKLAQALDRNCHQCSVRSLSIFKNFVSSFDFCVCYLHMQMQLLCRAVEISITTSYSTSVKMFYRGLTKVFIASPFCDIVHEGQVKRNHLS